MGGRHVDDSRVIPVCRSCHERCGGIRVNVSGIVLEPIGREEQERACLEQMRLFLDCAGPVALEAFGEALIARAKARVFDPIIPF